MRKLNLAIFWILITATKVVAAAENNGSPQDIKSTILLGLGPYFQTQPYTDTDTKLLPTPVFFFDNRLLYLRWTRIGMYVYGKQNWGVSLTAQPRVFGYQSKDSAVLTGMAERKSTWEGGVALGGKNSLGFAELTYFHDLLNRSLGSLVRLEFGKTITKGRWTHIPSIYIIRYSDSFNDYYYSVRGQEIMTGRPSYQAKAGTNYAVQDFVIVEVTRNWYVSANLRADLLASEITRSPIVDDQWMLAGMLSLMYKITF